MFADPDDKHWYCTSRYLRVPGHGSVNRSLDAVTEQRSLLLHLMGSMNHDDDQGERESPSSSSSSSWQERDKNGRRGEENDAKRNSNVSQVMCDVSQDDDVMFEERNFLVFFTMMQFLFLVKRKETPADGILLSFCTASAVK